MPGDQRPPPHERNLQHVAGLAAVRALFERGAERVERLFFEPRLKDQLAPFCQLLAAAHKPYREVEAGELERVAGTARHGGVVAVARPRPLAAILTVPAEEWARDGKPLIVLDGVGNPHNLGAIIRSVAFFGVDRIVLADRPEQALPSDAAYRVAEGGLEYVMLYRARFPDALRRLKAAYCLIGTALARGRPLREAIAGAGERPVAIVFGNEETGLEPRTLTACDAIVTLPGSGRVQSLNVAATAAILLHELAGGRSGS